MEIALMDALIGRPQGLVLEFGVAKGDSFKRLAEAVHPHIIYGFDSWLGLPAEWASPDGDKEVVHDCRGKFRCDKPEPPSNGILIEGLFGDTLEEFLRGHPGAVSFVHIDCDLYCSCAHILHCLVDRFVVGSVIAFDEINQGFGERQAFDKFKQASGQTWKLWGYQNPTGEVHRLVDKQLVV